MLDDYTVPDKNFRNTMNMRFETQELGAQTSATDTAHKGIKPKEFNISLSIPFKDKNHLTELIAIAQATKANGSLHVYDIVDELANAVKVRQVQFTDSFAAREDGSLKSWNIQFGLREYLSVPEKTEQRTETGAAAPQSAEGAVVTTEGGESEDDSLTPKTNFEKMLYKVDKALS